MAFATTSLQGRSDEQRSWDLQLGLSRVSYARHVKKPLRPLAAPPRYVEIVRRNLLEAGIVAPAQAPPGAATSSS
jgi:hypothetical protein